jgi:hypothetical protein
VRVDTISCRAARRRISSPVHTEHGTIAAQPIWLRHETQKAWPTKYSSLFPASAPAEVLQTERIVEARSLLRRKRDSFVEKLRHLPWPVTINRPAAHNRHPGNANICFHGFSAQEILNAVQPAFAASTGSACMSGISAPSHVLRAIGLSGDDAGASVRFSFGFTTRDEEIDATVDIIASALERLSDTLVANFVDLMPRRSIMDGRTRRNRFFEVALTLHLRRRTIHTPPDTSLIYWLVREAA